MWVPVGITVSMMHPVQNGVRPGDQERRPLRDEGQEVKESFAKPGHDKHVMGGIAMMKKCLCEERQKPMSDKQDQDRH